MEINNNEDTETKIEDTERYQFLMEESVRQYPDACIRMVHCAVCEQMLEEQGIEVDENDINEMKHLYCKKLEYDNMINAINDTTLVNED